MSFGLPPGWLWLVSGLVLLVLEVAAPGAFMVWLGLAAIGTGAITLAAGLAFGPEVVVFAVLAVLAILLGLRLRRPRRAPTLNTPQSGLVGRHARALAFEGGEGRVRLGDSDWSARLDAGPSPPPDTPMRVIGVEGTVLVVTPAAVAAAPPPSR